MRQAFECRMCGECCYGEGGITLNSQEIKNIARFLKIEESIMISEFCKIQNGRVSVITGPDNACIFYDKQKGCLVHPVKPMPCRRWPFYPALIKDRDNWELAKEACPGLNTGCSHEEFVREAEEWISSNT
jgi:hypothetical protein